MSDHRYTKTSTHIDGSRITGDGRETRPVINLTTGDAIGAVPLVTEAEISRALAGTGAGFAVWNTKSTIERSDIRRAATLMRDHAESMAHTRTMKQDKPLLQSRQDAMFGAEYVDWSAEESRRAYGAQIIQGLQNLNPEGTHDAPTVIANAPDAARVIREEPFGSTAGKIRFASDDRALALANKLPRGLASNLLTNDLRRAQYFPDKIEAGMVGVNGYAITVSETPFGRTRASGHGTGGHEGYLETKLVSYQ